MAGFSVSGRVITKIGVSLLTVYLSWSPKLLIILSHLSKADMLYVSGCTLLLCGGSIIHIACCVLLVELAVVWF